MLGLRRDEMVILNRLRHEYNKDALPDVEQIRSDFERVIAVVTRLNDEIDWPERPPPDVVRLEDAQTYKNAGGPAAPVQAGRPPDRGAATGGPRGD